MYPLSTIIQSDKCDAISKAIMNTKKYVCKYCGETYEAGCALGGHISKVHRNVGNEYAKKQNARNEKVVERDRLKYFKGIAALKKNDLNKRAKDHLLRKNLKKEDKSD